MSWLAGSVDVAKAALAQEHVFPQLHHLFSSLGDVHLVQRLLYSVHGARTLCRLVQAGNLCRIASQDLQVGATKTLPDCND